jgi:hypothetical protein
MAKLKIQSSKFKANPKNKAPNAASPGAAVLGPVASPLSAGLVARRHGQVARATPLSVKYPGLEL